MVFLGDSWESININHNYLKHIHRKAQKLKKKTINGILSGSSSICAKPTLSGAFSINIAFYKW